MYDEFVETYQNMRIEMLDRVKCQKLTLSRLKTATPEVQEKAFKWLKFIQQDNLYADAKKRYKECPDDRMEFYKLMDMKEMPEAVYRNRAYKNLRDFWNTSVPAIVRRANAKAPSSPYGDSPVKEG